MTELQIVDQKNPMMQVFYTERVQKQFALMLAGSPITPDQFFLDLATYLTANPKVLAECTPQSLFVAAVAAARHQASFGDGGFWIIPGIARSEDDESRPKGRAGGIRAQESKKHIEKCAREGRNDYGKWEITATLVFKDQKPDVEYVNGEVVGITYGGGNPFGDQKIEDMIGAFVTARSLDTEGKQVMAVLPRQDLDRMKNHSAAAKKGTAPAWRDDPTEMYKGTARAAMARRLCPIRWMSPGGVGGVEIPSDLSIELVGEAPQERKAIGSSADIAAELAGRLNLAAEYAKNAAEPRTTPVPGYQTPDALLASEWFSDMATGVRAQVLSAKDEGLDAFNEQLKERQKTWKATCPNKEVWDLFVEWGKVMRADLEANEAR